MPRKSKKSAVCKKNYEIANRDNRIAVLDKENEITALNLARQSTFRNGLLAALALVAILALVLWSRYRFKKQAEQKLATQNEELEKLNAAKNKFFAIIAHDLRNPLSAFKMLTTGLRENAEHYSTAELHEQLDYLGESTQQLSELLQNLLQWALSQTKSLAINTQTLDLSELLKRNIQLIQSAVQNKNIQVNMSTDTQLYAHADLATIDLVFRNLLANAVKFTHPDGAIHIYGSYDEQFVKVSIHDTGIGMSTHEQKMLFDITKDPSKIGHSPNKGSGLGLILCHEFIKKNQGMIHVDSAPDKGSVFTISLPKSNQAA